MRTSTLAISVTALFVAGCGSFESPGCVAKLSGHNAMVCAVAFTPGGQKLVSGGADGKIMLWDVASARCLRTWDGHAEWVHSVAVSPDGRYIASGGRDALVKLWDVASGQNLKTFTGHSGIVRSVAYSPDGKLLASCGKDTSIKIWDIASGECRMDLGTGSFFTCSAVEFVADGKRVFFGGDSLQLWDIESGKCLRTFAGHSDSVHALAISRDGKYVASAGAYTDDSVMLWDVETAECVWKKDFVENDSVWSLAFSADGETLVSGHHNGHIDYWQTKSGESLRTVRAHSEIVSVLAVDGAGQHIASGSWDKSIKLWTMPGR